MILDSYVERYLLKIFRFTKLNNHIKQMWIFRVKDQKKLPTFIVHYAKIFPLDLNQEYDFQQTVKFS